MVFKLPSIKLLKTYIGNHKSPEKERIHHNRYRHILKQDTHYALRTRRDDKHKQRLGFHLQYNLQHFVLARVIIECPICSHLDSYTLTNRPWTIFSIEDILYVHKSICSRCLSDMIPRIVMIVGYYEPE